MLSDWQPPKKHISPFGPDYILGPIRPQFDPVWEVAHMNFPFLNVSTCPLWAVYMQMIKWRPEKSQKNAMDQRNMETDKQIQGAKHTQKGAGFLCVKSRFTGPGGISALFCIYTNADECPASLSVGSICPADLSPPTISFSLPNGGGHFTPFVRPSGVPERGCLRGSKKGTHSRLFLSVHLCCIMYTAQQREKLGYIIIQVEYFVSIFWPSVFIRETHAAAAVGPTVSRCECNSQRHVSLLSPFYSFYYYRPFFLFLLWGLFHFF